MPSTFAIAVSFLFQVEKEETILIEKFGDTYPAYIQEIGRFLSRPNCRTIFPVSKFGGLLEREIISMRRT
jgi:hypothetical protein